MKLLMEELWFDWSGLVWTGLDWTGQDRSDRGQTLLIGRDFKVKMNFIVKDEKYEQMKNRVLLCCFVVLYFLFLLVALSTRGRCSLLRENQDWTSNRAGTTTQTPLKKTR